MAERKSFKLRIKDEAIRYAKLFKNYFIDYEYLICSDAFQKEPYYIIQAHEDNYKHLIGVSASINAAIFFDKCIHETLEESDFSFKRRGQTELEVKGSVRRKINVLPCIMNLFDGNVKIVEDFEKNRIKCSIAVGKIECTLGFSPSVPAKPMTLLKGNQLDESKSKPIALVLRRKAGEEKFGELVVGNDKILEAYYPQIKNLLTEHLIREIENKEQNL